MCEPELEDQQRPHLVDGEPAGLPEPLDEPAQGRAIDVIAQLAAGRGHGVPDQREHVVARPGV